jgi:MFS family permease
MNDNRMTTDERRATWGLGAVFSLRMLGMFMVLPVLTTYGMALQGATQSLIGIAIGIYGLAQALFQIPFGLLSDRVGLHALHVGQQLSVGAGSGKVHGKVGLALARIALQYTEFSKRKIWLPKPFHRGQLHVAHADDLHRFRF